MITIKQKTYGQQTLDTAHHDYEKGLILYAFFKLKNHTTGEDLVQDTFIKTWDYILKGKKIKMMKAFLYHVLNNLIISEYRKRKNATVSLDTLFEKGFEPSVEDSGRLFNILDGKAALVLIGCLPKIYQKIMRLRFVNDLSLTEISLITGQTKNSIAVQVCRALEKLRILHDSQ